MKKLFILLLICLCLTSCKETNAINYDMYIASMGFEKKGEEYTGYFFLPSSIAVGSTETQESDKPSELATVTGKSLADVFNNFDLSSTLDMNMKHVASMVLHESILNDDDINYLIDYMNKSKDFDLNFYVYTAKDEMKDVFKNKNPNNESIILTMLCEPINNNLIYTTAKPIHFLNFCRDFFSNKVIAIPLIEPLKVWNEETDSNYCRGITYYSNSKGYTFDKTEKDFEFLYSKKELKYNDENIVSILQNYKVDIKYKTKVQIEVKGKLRVLKSKVENPKKYMEDTIKSGLESLISKYQEEIDILNTKYHNASDKEISISFSIKESE